MNERADPPARTPRAPEPLEQADAARLATLLGYDILDTPREQAFDDIVLLATQLCEAPVALVSLVAADRQWFKAAAGTDLRETPLSQSVCAHGVSLPGLLVIPDLTLDARTRENTLVTEAPRFRFYAGARLDAPDGNAIGMLCVLDTKARPEGLTDRQAHALAALARQVMAQLELRRAVAALESHAVEQSRARSRTWQVSPDLLSVIDMETGVFDAVNPAWTAALGWRAEQMEGQPFSAFLHPDDAASSRDAFQQARGGRPVLHFENRYRRGDGEHRWLEWNAVPEGGKLYSRARDVTREKEQAAALAQRTADRDRMWRLSPDVMLVADLQATIVALNPAWTTILGWEEGEWLGKSFLELVHPEDVAGTLAELATLNEGATTFSFQNRYRHRDGSFRTLAWTAVPDALLIHGVGRDVTLETARRSELAEAQEALRQSQKMEAVGQLTGGLAHDFNNLLTVISGSLERIETSIGNGRLAESERYLVAARLASKRAAALTHRMLAFSRRQTLDPRAIDINLLVAGMDDMVRRTVGPQISVEFVGAGGLWNTLVDPNQLENALLNLCINARDAMPDGGRLTVETANKWLDDRVAREREVPPGQYVALSVSDTGVGMAPEVVARAFDPFFTTKPIGEGTGLGLSMIYGFARQSGGQVRIYSEPGRGTTACIYLPRHHGAASDPREMAPAIPAQTEAGESVLVVDDEPGVRMLIVETLEGLGYRAIEAADGMSGLEALRAAKRVDLLVTDVGLPGGMNGRQLADAARTVLPDLKVLFITGYAENAVIGSGHLDTGMAVVTKPFPMDVLANRIREMIAGSPVQGA